MHLSSECRKARFCKGHSSRVFWLWSVNSKKKKRKMINWSSNVHISHVSHPFLPLPNRSFCTFWEESKQKDAFCTHNAIGQTWDKLRRLILCLQIVRLTGSCKPAHKAVPMSCRQNESRRRQSLSWWKRFDSLGKSCRASHKKESCHNHLWQNSCHLCIAMGQNQQSYLKHKALFLKNVHQIYTCCQHHMQFITVI